MRFLYMKIRKDTMMTSYSEDRVDFQKTKAIQVSFFSSCASFSHKTTAQTMFSNYL